MYSGPDQHPGLGPFPRDPGCPIQSGTWNGPRPHLRQRYPGHPLGTRTLSIARISTASSSWSDSAGTSEATSSFKRRPPSTPYSSQISSSVEKVGNRGRLHRSRWHHPHRDTEPTRPSPIGNKTRDRAKQGQKRSPQIRHRHRREDPRLLPLQDPDASTHKVSSAAFTTTKTLSTHR